MTQRVLVTGSEGFTGRYVCAEFENAGWEVWGAGVQPKPDNLRYLNINLLQPETLRLISERVQTLMSWCTSQPVPLWQNLTRPLLECRMC